MSTNDTARSELVLRLTDAQIAAIRLRNQRRKKNVGGTGELDLGDISSVHGDLSQTCPHAAVEGKDGVAEPASLDE